MTPAPLPSELGDSFSVPLALSLGVRAGRLRGSDLERPFRGVRSRRAPAAAPSETGFEAERAREIELIRALAARAVPGQFLSHRSAALIWGIPVPHASTPELHLSVHLPRRSPRVSGVIGHALPSARSPVVDRDGCAVTSAACTWAQLGHLSLIQLVVAGDAILRVHRPGYGRPDAGKPPLATREELAEVLALGRWPGMARLRRAFPLLREDSWSPMESEVRLLIVSAGLPEPELNLDVFTDSGEFIGCVDLAYLKYRIAIEYQSDYHLGRLADDLEKAERLKEAGWSLIQVTKTVRSDSARLIGRITKALRERGWEGEPGVEGARLMLGAPSARQ